MGTGERTPPLPCIFTIGLSIPQHKGMHPTPSLHLHHWTIHSTAQGSTVHLFPASSLLDGSFHSPAEDTCGLALLTTLLDLQKLKLEPKVPTVWECFLWTDRVSVLAFLSPGEGFLVEDIPVRKAG
ncbi:hypothetical protein U0070_017744 [Myodes glareolus]|uniref:Uncharacterized protein n=1 Tax=Myodes glareolus TaxID=447135 RepID=A0AAW0HTJ4_MYOGA